MSQQASKAIEPPFYYFTDGWYKGDFPCFYDTTNFKATEILKKHYPELRDEIISYYEKNAEKLKPNYSPYNYKPKGWKTINLYSYFLKYHKPCEDFPVVDRIVNQIPHMCAVQIGILEPHSRIKAHMGDTNGIVRNHLGIRIPGKHPELGFRVGSEEKCWEEGEVLAICVGHRHYAWNSTDHYRIVLVVDVIRDEYVDKKYEIAGKTMAVVALRHFSTRYPFLKKSPVWLSLFTQKVLGLGFRSILFLQRRFGWRIEEWIR